MAEASVIKEFLVKAGFAVDETSYKKFLSGIGSATAVVTGIGAAIAATAGVVFKGVKDIASEFDKLDKAASKLRTTADKLDDYNDIGQILGLEDGVAMESLQALNTAMADTSLGMGRAKKVFEELGLSVTGADGKLKSTTDMMDELQVKLKGMETGKAIRIMERLGIDPAMMKIFNADTAALRAELEAIDKAAGFDFGDAIKESKLFMAAWRGLTQEWQKVRIAVSTLMESIAVKLMPRLRGAIDIVAKRVATFRKTVMDNFGGIRTVIDGVVDAILRVFGFMAAVVGRAADILTSIVSRLISMFGGFDSTLVKAIGGIVALGVAWRVLNSAFLASPIGRLIALGVVILGLVDDFMTWKEGGDSFFDWARWAPGIEALLAVIETFASIVTMALDGVSNAFDGLGKLLSGDFAGAWDSVGKGIQTVVDIMKAAWSMVTGLTDAVGAFFNISGLSGKIGSALSGAASAVGSSFAASGGGGMSAPMGLMGTNAEMGGGSTVNVESTINVQGAGDAGATGRAVAAEQTNVANDTLRNMKGAIR